MQIVQFVPGAIASPNPITLPTTAPGIDAVVGAEITRLPSALGAHAAGAAPVAHVATAAPVVHAGADVADHADHAHDLISQGVGGAVGVAIGWDAVAPITQLEDAGAAALHTLAGGGATGVQDQAIPAHVVTQPNNHLAADIVASVDDHPAADIAAGLADHVGADPVVAATPTRLTARTISLNVNTLVGDILTLAYLEVGERIAVS